MPYIECCLSNCRMTKYDVKLFNFPRDNSLRDLWLRCTAPYTSHLKNMALEDITQRKVCILHFEKKYIVEGKRIYEAFPTLITPEEITTGVPSNANISVAALNPVREHDYGKKLHTEMVMGPPAKISRPSSDADAIIPETTIPTVVVVPDETPCSSTVVQQKDIQKIRRMRRPKLVSNLKVLTPRCRNIYDKCKKILVKRKLFSNNELIERADSKESTKLLQSFNKLKNIQKKFLLMQLKIAGRKEKARRYTLEEKLLSLALFKQSPKGYSLLQKIFCLPNKRTLNRILSNIKLNTGINKDFFNALKVKVSQWTPASKICSIIFDEVQLSPHLNYMPNVDTIHGFIDNSENPKFADHALVFMIRGVVASWRQPIAYYFCEGTIPAAALILILKEITAAVLSAGLDPVTFICDQGITFQSAIKSLQENTRRHQILNNLECDDTILLNDINMSVVYDPPHLLKGIRNNLLTKDLIFEGEKCTWQDIIDIYNFDCELGDIRLLPKLTDEHVIPDKIRKMKVSHCTKVFSERVAAALMYTGSFSQHKNGGEISATMKSTAKSVAFFDKLFDSCNGSRRGRCPGKLRGAVNVNSEHEKFWNTAIKTISNTYYIEKNTRETVHKSVPTLKNWVTTLKSLIRLKKYILSKEVKFYYTRNLNQDPLENFFGKIRSYNFRNNNPDTYTFQNSYKALMINNIIGVHSKHSNCEDDVGTSVLNLSNFIKKDDLEEMPQEHEQNVDISNSPLEMSTTERTFSHNPLGEGTSSQSPLGQSSVISKECLVLNEKIKVNARCFTSGYVARRLFKYFKCQSCKNTIVTKEISGIHRYTKSRERSTLKHDNLIYTNTRFVVAFSRLMDITNQYLEKNCHKRDIVKNITKYFQSNVNIDWLGCSTHHDDLIRKFIAISLKVQIYNWVKSINLILSGAVQSKINNNSDIHKLAQIKYYKSKRIKKSRRY